MLERAFAAAGEEFDVVSYLALGRNRGKFLHVGADGIATLVEVPNAYGDISLERRTVILKIHGGIDRGPSVSGRASSSARTTTSTTSHRPRSPSSCR